MELQLEKELIKNKMVQMREMLCDEIQHIKDVEEAQISFINKLQLQREENLRVRYEDLEKMNQSLNKKLYEEIDADANAILTADKYSEKNDDTCRVM